MRQVRLELLRPQEIVEEKKRLSIVYLPVGPLEWHGPHLAVGMDPLNAEAISRLVAEKVGGVVMPTFYWGTERERSPEMLKNIGFKGNEWIVGMDFPKNIMPSFYAHEEPFAIAVREYLNILARQKYKLIVIVNGHGAENHINALTRLAKEFTAETDSTVLYTITTFLDEDGKQDFGHATKVETSILTYLHPECVGLDQLPPKEKKLFNLDYAIVDDATFRGNPTSDFSVVEDPRDAVGELGKKTVENSVRIISKMVMEVWNNINVK
jgi:creatinine amidohydrolase